MTARAEPNTSLLLLRMLRGALLRAGCRPTPTPTNVSCSARRSLFGLSLKRKPPPQAAPQKPKVVLSQDDLFHPLSRSPFPALRARGEAVRSMAPCPVCLEEHGERTPVSYECPDCGWPTHASEDHWRNDRNHAKYCGRLREVNEDEHDLRSGRKIWEFELPGALRLTSFWSMLKCYCISPRTFQSVHDCQANRPTKQPCHSQTGTHTGLPETIRQ